LQVHKLTIHEFEKQYRERTITELELDIYFQHDRSMRESGHDTTTRLDHISANLNTVDLNSILYKYETDIAELIQNYFEDSFKYKNEVMDSSLWFSKANKRKKQMMNLMWNEAESTFCDYNFTSKEQQPYYSASNLYPLWAKICSEEQAQKIVKNHLPKYSYKGGIASTSQETIGSNSTEGKERQWDFPYGWAPHQMLIWKGLINYGFEDKAQEIIYRWLWLIVKAAVNYNGLIPEKFNVEECTHQVDVEYGNVGTNFKYVPEGGFGWINASFKLGVKLLNNKYVDNLNLLTDPDMLFDQK